MRRKIKKKPMQKNEGDNKVQDYRFAGEKRTNIPDAGLASSYKEKVVSKKYSYDPHLDPQLVWAGKVEHADLDVDTVALHMHERISTKAVLRALTKRELYKQMRLFAEPDLPMDKRIEFYQHEMDWTNRLVLGDSLLVMNSLLEREMMAGKVQMIYVDPPYGVAYGSNFQPSINQRDVKDGRDDSLTRQIEQIKAYRDTWVLGVHSYLSYLRDRLLLCRDLLTESGSIFVQIGDTNLHHVRELMDEIFGSQNFVAQIVFRKTGGGRGAKYLDKVYDALLWYANEYESLKYRQLFLSRAKSIEERYEWIELPNGECIHLSGEQIDERESIPNGRRYALEDLTSQGDSQSGSYTFEFEGEKYRARSGRHWTTTPDGMARLVEAKRIQKKGNNIFYKRFMDDYPVRSLADVWEDTAMGGYLKEEKKIFVVQTPTKVIERCILMTTDPSDLVMDPTCGSGTTAYCAEKLGRRWVTCDTSRIALALSRQRLLCASFPYYSLAHTEQGVAGGFVYDTVPHITLKSLAQNEPQRTETIYDKPVVDHEIVRVSGPFTVEAIPIPSVEDPSLLVATKHEEEKRDVATNIAGDYLGTIISLVEKDGITFPGGKLMKLDNITPIQSANFLHAEAEVRQGEESVRVAISFGPRYGPITAKQVMDAAGASHMMGFKILIFAGFAFDPEAQATIQKYPHPNLQIHMATIRPDVEMSDLLKSPRGSQLFTVFGQPDVKIKKDGEMFTVELLGVDVYDPIKGEVHPSRPEDVAAWFLDQDYDGYTFCITQAFFPKEATSRNPWDRLENALHGVIAKERMDKLRGTTSLQFRTGDQKRIAIKVIDQRGNEVVVVKKLEETVKE